MPNRKVIYRLYPNVEQEARLQESMRSINRTLPYLASR